MRYGGLYAVLYAVVCYPYATLTYMATKMITIRTTDDGLAWLKLIADHQGRTVSDVVRRAIETQVGAEPKFKTFSPRSNRVTVRLEEGLADSLEREGAKVSDVVAGCLRDYQFSQDIIADGGKVNWDPVR